MAYYYQEIKLYNKLPDSIKNLTENKLLYQILKNNVFYGVNKYFECNF